MVLKNAFGAIALDETVQQVLAALMPRFMVNTSTFARQITAPDSISPQPGMSLRVLWVAFAPDPDAEDLAPTTIRFLGEPEPLYMNYALAHWQIFEGEVDQPLEIVPGNAVPVTVTVHYQDF